ncbi:MAG: hypothetical protein KAT43_04750, partial [Nanoarchaeota archaeon]|nr:hypothetical protein [Nanoarchaeota archaeon]
VRLDKDSPNINDNDRLDYDTFMQDDRVLMIAGSPDNREALAKMLFGAKKDGGEGWDSVGSYHRINEVGFDTTARGRLVYLYYDVDGLGGDSGIYYSGRFFGVSDRVAQLSAEGAAHERSTTQGIVYPTLEQTLAIVNNPILNRVGMVRAISQLYK